MRNWLWAVLVMISLTLSAAAQKTAPLPQKDVEAQQTERAQALQRALAEFEYRAKMDIPAVDCIFVEDGKIIEGMYRSALKDHPKALAAGALTKISRVKVMERGVQVFFATDSCALIGVSAAAIDTATMGSKELLEMTKKTISALFQTVPRESQERPASK